MMLVAANVLYTAPLTLAWISAWYLLRGLPVDVGALQVVTLTNVICVVFVTHAYETVFLIRERESDMMRVERLERMRVEGELAALTLADRSALPVQQPQHPRPRDRPRPGAGARLLRPAGRGLPLRARQPRPAAGVARRRSWTSSPTTTPCSPCASARRSSWWSSRRRSRGRRRRRGSRRWRCRPCSRTRSSTTASIRTLPLGMRLSRLGGAVRFAHEQRPRSSTRPGAGVGLANLDERCRLLTGRGLAIERGGGEFAVTVPLAQRVNLFLVEDEAPARERLIETIGRVEPAARIAGVAASVREARAWLAAHPPPDLMLLDVQLADGLSFELFAPRHGHLPGDLRHRLRRVRARGVQGQRDRLCAQAGERRGPGARLRRLPAAEEPLRGRCRPARRRPGGGAVAPRGSGSWRAAAPASSACASTTIAWFVSVDKTTWAVASDGQRHLVEPSLAELEAAARAAALLSHQPPGHRRRGRGAGLSPVGQGPAGARSSSPAATATVSVTQERAAAFREWLAVVTDAPGPTRPGPVDSRSFPPRRSPARHALVLEALHLRRHRLHRPAEGGAADPRGRAAARPLAALGPADRPSAPRPTYGEANVPQQPYVYQTRQR